ncbi:MAG: nucleotidyltransferase domain-containing protein [Alphaproteobacteria bacterium]|nr:nucleotidyltransferase domain-containing protein [Alphaproteobacteria bacterium]
MKKNEYKIIQDILMKFVPDAKVIALGSRKTGKNVKPFSDLDLAIITPIKFGQLLGLREAFCQSDLPFRVDVLTLSGEK